MAKAAIPQLEPQRFEDGRPMLIAGPAKRYTAATMQELPQQWQRLARHIGKIPGQVGHVAYGVITDQVEGSSGIGYLCGVEVAGSPALPADFSRIRIPALRYAVFIHSGHLCSLRSTIDAIWRQWLPGSGYEAAGEPGFVERYSEEFDPDTGMGGIEICVPIKT